MQTQEVTKLKIGHLDAKTLAVSTARPLAHVLLLGNAYGVLPYQVLVAEELAKRGFKPYWFPFTGQSGTVGTFSSGSGVEDVRVALSYLRETATDAPVQILSHCVGSLFAMGCLERNPELRHVTKSLIVYGLLFNPGRRRPIAEPKLAKAGVESAASNDDWNYNCLGDIAALEIPVLFCHARDRINLSRCTEEELTQAVQVAKDYELEWFEHGYDKRLENVPKFIERYEAWLTKHS